MLLLFPGPRLLVFGTGIGLNFLPFFLQHFLAWASISDFDCAAVDLLFAITLARILADTVLFKVIICVVFLIQFGGLVTCCIAMRFRGSGVSEGSLGEIGGWPGFKDLEFVDMEAAERISL